MTRRDEGKAETRRRIAAAAEALFTERGYDGTTTQAVAARAGVAAGTVFTHFADKPSLLAGVLHEGITTVLSVPPTGPDVRARFLDAAGRLYRWYGAHPELS